ncbi:S-adenosylmethionine:tRNA ribosyltransferase-isomerase [Aliidongia dinghuensis]|uniref:S-adenosylmethionine:tRNA ribosyltransferase-isomerase n=1 Tax=Aliidongia dinghuensis TaxID=1867774 RepID=A0A8J3E342_9PROT|nr:tRNA preQ1(34) S-adenosylmethionine ribosyltransferase-isomerase QueA [Aliidongia dinghuensis]GGF13288.1 S-adenosylmethionine:tRNA ribosyltransferase-isomerase [Aliidongia dinghuensis]
MRVDAFDFELPPDRIAQRPVEPRDAARLLCVTADAITDRQVRDLPDLLAPGDLLVFNDTRVVPARLVGRRGAATVSITLHQALALDTWLVFAKPGKRLRVGDRVEFADDFSAEVLEKRPAGDIALRFDRGGAALMTALHEHGRIPLPPYIRGGVADERDRSDYQTLFAREEGAVAAPTAALHFTEDLMAALAAKGIGSTMLTLHVGAGTFLPVKVEDTSDHVMHEELGVLTAETAERINRTRAAGGRIVAVGTTSLRLLESAAGDDGRVRPFEGGTRLFITPGYRFKAIDRLMTNFHLPRSTLFMLVAAFAGLERMQAAYVHARETGYRFYSYGDASLLDPETRP